MTLFTQCVFLVVLAFVCCTWAAPAQKNNDMLEDVVEAVLHSRDSASSARRKKREANSLNPLDYLSKFNYLPQTGASGDGVSNIMTEEAYKEAIKKFQQFAGLPQSGEMDAATMATMKLPRCGVPDIVNVADYATKRRKRYAVGGTKWGSTSLSYKINKYTSDMSTSLVNSEIHRALQVWENVTPLRFTRETSGNVDIDIIFGAKNHGDSEPFDGSGGTLAHAYFPQRNSIGGDAHFDDDETFTANTRSGINLFQVAAHEFGHSLGLSHSSNQNALMAPFYRGYQPNFELDQDDIAGIQYLYGDNTAALGNPTTTRATTTRRTTTTTTTRSPVGPNSGGGSSPSYCQNSKIDAITRDDTYTYIFQGDKYSVISNTGVASGYPRYISTDWESLPNNIDAALYIKPSSGSTTGTGNTYFFKGDQVWKFVNRAKTWQHSISDVVSGLPANIDSAFVYPGNDRIYFTKGNKYYKLASSGQKIEAGYPRALTTWWSNSGSRNQLSAVDGAFTWTNDKLYFFKDERYHRFSPQQFKIESNYPRDTGYWWFGCPANLEAAEDLQANESEERNNDTGNDENGVIVISTNEQNAQASTAHRPLTSGLTLLSSILVLTLAALLH